MPALEARISKFLQGDEFRDEFCHTLLHNQNVFEEFKKIQAKKKEEEERKAEEAEQLAKAAQGVNLYQPTQQYMDKFQDPSFFNHAYQKYIAELNKDTSESDGL